MQERVDERRLAGTGLAPREHAGAAPAQRPGERAAQPRQLRLAPRRHRRAGARGRRGGGCDERRVVVEDPALERARRGARREAELEQPPRELAVGRERLDLAPGREQRDHQRADELLAQRVGSHQPPQLGDRLQRPAELDERAGARPLRLAAQVLEPAHLGARELGVGEVAVRRPAPQRQAAVEHLQRGRGGQRGGRVHAAFEAVRVDLLRVDRQAVAGAVADEQRRRGAAVAAGLEVRAQVRHAHRERAGRDLAGDAVPARVQQRVRRHGAARVEQQPREDRPLLRARRRRPGGGAAHLDRAQDAEVHRAHTT